MTLVVETGSVVAGANSYVTLAEARNYATARGITLSATDSVVEAQLIKAMDYLEAKRSFYQGSKTSLTQVLQWPRTSVTIDDVDFSANAIPNELKSAQIQLAIEVANGVDIMPTRQAGQFVKREKVGPIETEFSETVGVTVEPTLTAVEALLEPLYKVSAGFKLRTVRV